MIRLDLGAGEVSPEGFTPMGKAHNTEIFPLPVPDESCDVIRASHVLEHFPHGHVQSVVNEWVRALKPGGILRIAVPDFEKIAQGYLEGAPLPTEGYLMGGQIDGYDYHKAIFDRGKLKQLLAAAGLVLHREWKSEIEGDCASLPISLNIEGTKPFQSEIKVSAAMSVPRLGFMDNFSSCIDGLIPLGIKLRRQGGAFWGQALTNCLEIILEEDKPDAILTLDYDSLFTKAHVAHLIQLMLAHPEADAIAPVQSSRHLQTALFTVQDETGKNIGHVPMTNFEDDLQPIETAHFGLTLIRAEKLNNLPRPWFMPVPDSDGRWTIEGGRIDEDINFWRKWREAGNTLFLANRVAIGHMELVSKWPGKDLQALYQPVSDFHRNGPPKDMWK